MSKPHATLAPCAFAFAVATASVPALAAEGSFDMAGTYSTSSHASINGYEWRSNMPGDPDCYLSNRVEGEARDLPMTARNMTVAVNGKIFVVPVCVPAR